jgi:hypothetical protein
VRHIGFSIDEDATFKESFASKLTVPIGMGIIKKTLDARYQRF